MNKLDEYENVAKRLLSRFGRYISKNQDYIDIVVSYLYVSDEKYDPTKGEFKTWRFGMLKNAVRKILRVNKQFIAEKSNEVEITPNTTCSRTQTPLQELMDAEQVSRQKEVIGKLINSPAITDTERFYIKSHFLEEKTQQQIADENFVSKQAVSVTMLKGLRKLKDVYGRQEIYN